ncbi:MAG: LamG domain-containing protein [Candidatus Pacebacteria bacterium]|nr:LamG domain-containing protein [Candidatus Paceibacterota bacterium]MDD5555545.1 LamG domain-containing protein [Candidatus Paceibacterota bacterium]
MNKSFTLIEILVVIVIIGIISAFIIVSMVGVSDKATIAKGQAFSSSLKNSLMLNLVSEWKLDGNASDSWGTNNGTLVGPTHLPVAKSGTDCISGGCYQFDGTEDYITAGSLANNLGQSFTVEAWSKRLGSTGSYGNLVQINTWGAGQGGFLIFDRNNGVIQGRIYSSADATEASLNIEINAPDNIWRHYVFTWAKPYFSAYLNGAKLGPVSWDHDVGWTNNVILIANWASYYFYGLLDNVRIYNSAVPTSQIEQNYYSGLNKLLAQGGFDVAEYQQRLGELKMNLTRND